MPSMVLLNSTGDLTIGWDDSQHDNMVRLIEEKMKAGFTFFVIKKGILKNTKVELTNINQLNNPDFPVNSINIGDEDIQKLFAAGGLSVGQTPEVDRGIPKLSRDPNEIVESDSMMLRPIAAG